MPGTEAPGWSQTEGREGGREGGPRVGTARRSPPGLPSAAQPQHGGMRHLAAHGTPTAGDTKACWASLGNTHPRPVRLSERWPHGCLACLIT